jgi:recombination protein RecT
MSNFPANRATNQSLARSAAPSNPVAQLKAIANDPKMMNRFKQVIGEKAPQFLASVVSAVSTNNELLKADPNSVMASAMVAATLDLDINQSLGFAAIVPYNRNRPIKDNQGNIVRWEKSTEAQFQIMTKGLVQLAIRSGQYRNINVIEVYEDEFEDIDIISGELHMHPVSGGQRSRGESGMIVGYVAYLKLVSGFEKTVYWPLEKILQHAAKFSKSWDSKTGRFRKGSAWADNFEAMCRKTVLKNALSTWGILSVQMQKAIVSDQGIMASVDNPAQIEYPDGQENSELDGPAEQQPVEDQQAPETVEPEVPQQQEATFSEEDEAALDAMWGNA